MNIFAGKRIIPGMDITELLSTNDPDTLRQLALSLLEENRQKDASLSEKDHQIHQLKEALMLARQQRFGRQAESFSGLQRSLFEEDADADIASAETQLARLLPETEEKKACPARKPLPAHLPREDTVIRPESGTCPDCGQPLRHIRDEISERLDYIPAQFVVKRYVRPQYGCDGCQRVVSGCLPAQIIPKGIPEAGLVAQVLVSKYCDRQPLYHQQQVFVRAGVELPVSTLAGWVGAASVWLMPLAELLCTELLSRPVLHADETPLQILNTKKDGKVQNGYLWAYVSGETTGDGVVCFDGQPGRAARYPEAWLAGWSGTLVTDGYAVYHSLKNGSNILNAGCWAHARRGFAALYKANRDPHAGTALKMIHGLYSLEKKIRHRSPEKRRQWRQRYAKPQLNTLWAWLTAQEQKCAPGSALHKAIKYALSHKTELSRFVDDGALPLDNNRCERAIRQVVMGRKTWLFAGSLQAGYRAAAVMSLLETARLNGVEPYGWLKQVLERLPSLPEERLHELLPFAKNLLNN
ncbi:TPA: IS66 family transposase [Salmonella enterica]|nr:IS66 family transposase [Salmonella enterica]